MKVGESKETVVDNQLVGVKEKLKNTFGHLDPTNPPEVCPIRDILSVASDKWSILIILFLGGHDKLRFNELKKYLYGVSSKSLSQRLKTLERDGYLKREVFPEVPIRVEYELTKFGYEYLDKLIQLVEWIDINVPEVVKQRNNYDAIFKKK